MSYEKIIPFCSVRNKGNCLSNGESPTPRVNFITDLCDEMGIKYEIDKFKPENKFKPISHLSKVRRAMADNPELYKSKSLNLEIMFKDFLKKAREVETDEEYDELEDLYSQKFIKIMGNDYDKFVNDQANYFFNIMLLGSSDKFVVAHHDIVNPNSENANDNSCSVINAIMIKKLRPEVNVFLVDGEEMGGIGSKRMAERINSGDFNCRYALNLELTGKGGSNFFVGSNGSPIQKWIEERFDCPIVEVPFNDSVILKKMGIDSAVINPLPITDEPGPVSNKNGYMDMNLLYKCHSLDDKLSNIDPMDMKEFVEEICLKIIDEY